MKTEIKEKGVEKYLDGVEKHIDQRVKLFAGVTELDDDEDYVRACDELFETSVYIKQVADEKDKVIGAAKTIIATVSGWFKPREKKIDAHFEHLKDLVRAYNIAREELSHDIKKDAAKLAKLDSKRARELQAKSETVLPPKVAGIAFSGKVTVTVVDEAKLPEVFFKRVVDTALLQAHVEAGEVVPGVLIEDNRTVRVTPSQRAEQ